jgi:hypothetical protein
VKLKSNTLKKKLTPHEAKTPQDYVNMLERGIQKLHKIELLLTIGFFFVTKVKSLLP